MFVNGVPCPVIENQPVITKRWIIKQSLHRVRLVFLLSPTNCVSYPSVPPHILLLVVYYNIMRGFSFSTLT